MRFIVYKNIIAALRVEGFAQKPNLEETFHVHYFAKCPDSQTITANYITWLDFNAVVSVQIVLMRQKQACVWIHTKGQSCLQKVAQVFQAHF